MDLDTLLAGAIQQNAPQILVAAATETLQTMLKGAVTVPCRLDKDQQDYIRVTTVGIPLLFQGSTPAGSHPVLSAARIIIRDVFNRMTGVNKSSLAHLVVGASMREIKTYGPASATPNPHVSYHIAYSDNKDVDRFLVPFMDDVKKKLVSSCTTDSNVLRTAWNEGENPANVSTVRTIDTWQEAVNLWELAYKSKHRIFVDGIPNNYACDVLLFEDVGYNFAPADWCRWFHKTKAVKAYGYMCLPYELLFDHMVEDPYYKLSRRTSGLLGEKFAELTYRGGSASAGYSHPEETWSLLLKHSTFTATIEDEKITLAVELCERSGPMQLFTITRVAHRECMVRTISLPPSLKYVRVLNVRKAYNGMLRWFTPPTFDSASDATYFSVPQSEWLKTFTYVMSIEPKARNMQNIAMYVRKNRSGLTLTAKEFAAHWKLDSRLEHEFVRAIYLQAKLTEISDETMTEEFMSAKPGLGPRLAAMLKTTLLDKVPLLKRILTWLHTNELHERLVLWPPDEIFQREYSCATREVHTLRLFDAEEPEGADFCACTFCEEAKHMVLVPGTRVAQDFRCLNPANTFHTFSKTAEQMEVWRVHLQTSKEENPNELLRKAISLAIENMPRSGYSRECEVSMVTGPPGCGKSMLIRQLAHPTRDLIIIPFRKLRPDYTDQPQHIFENKKYVRTDKTVRWNVKTPHHAYEVRGVETIYVDEFTSLDYRVLCDIVYLTHAKRVVLVGDVNQTRIRDMFEGEYIGANLDLNTVQHHMLAVNYRNPPQVVAILNMLYYQDTPMISAKAIDGETRHGFEVGKISELTSSKMIPPDSNAFAFSHEEATTFCSNPDNTVRSCQGSTFKTSVLYLTAVSGVLSTMDPMAIVAISRHTDSFILAHDGSAAAYTFITKHKLDDKDFLKTGYAQFLGSREADKVSARPVSMNLATKLLKSYPSAPVVKTSVCVMHPNCDHVTTECLYYETASTMCDMPFTRPPKALDPTELHQVNKDWIRVPDLHGKPLSYWISQLELLKGNYALTYSQGAFHWFIKFLPLFDQFAVAALRVAGTLLQIVEPSFKPYFDAQCSFPPATASLLWQVYQTWFVTMCKGVSTQCLFDSVDEGGWTIVGSTLPSYRSLYVNISDVLHVQDVIMDLMMIPGGPALQYLRSKMSGPSWSDDGSPADIVFATTPTVTSVDPDSDVDFLDLSTFVVNKNDPNLPNRLTHLTTPGYVPYPVAGIATLSKLEAWRHANPIVPLSLPAYNHNSTLPAGVYDPNIVNEHKGQLKLLVSELIFLKQCKLSTHTVVYVGGACGSHLVHIVRVYPDAKILVIDPDNMDPHLTVNRLPATWTAPMLKAGINHMMVPYNLTLCMQINAACPGAIYMFDNRNNRGGVTGVIEDADVWLDQAHVLLWLLELKPIAALTKMRPYYADGTIGNIPTKYATEYNALVADYTMKGWAVPALTDTHIELLDGQAQHQYFAKSGSAERRLFIIPSISWTRKNWDCAVLRDESASWNIERNRIVATNYGIATVEQQYARAAIRAEGIHTPDLVDPRPLTKSQMRSLAFSSGIEIASLSKTSCFYKTLGVDMQALETELAKSAYAGYIPHSKLVEEMRKTGTARSMHIRAYAAISTKQLVVMFYHDFRLVKWTLGTPGARDVLFYDGVGHFYHVATVNAEPPEASFSVLMAAIAEHDFSGRGKPIEEDVTTNVFEAPETHMCLEPEESGLAMATFDMQEEPVESPEDAAIIAKGIKDAALADKFRILMREKRRQYEKESNQAMSATDYLMRNSISVRNRLLLETVACPGSSNEKAQIERPDPLLDTYRHPASDAYLTSTMHVSTVSVAPDILALNEVQSVIVRSGFRSTSVDPDELISPTNARGNIITAAKKYRSVTPGEGNVYSDKNQFAALKTMRERYDAPREEIPITQSSIDTAEQMVSHYFRNFKRMHMTLEQYADLHLEEIMNKFLLDAGTKHYFTRVDSENGWDDPKNVNLVRFHLKSIFKPFVSTKEANFDKAGQGISAWSPVLLMVFCVAFRLLAYYDRDTDRRDDWGTVLTDNGVNDHVFLSQVALAMEDVSKLPTQRVIGDAIAFDSKQDAFTQLIESQFIKRLGVSTEFIEMYMVYRRHRTIIGKFFTTKQTFEKQSGEPATLWLNGVVMRVSCMWTVDIYGRWVMVYKGDDVALVGNGITKNEPRMNQMHSCTILRLKILFVDQAEFCGMILAAGVLVPNIHRTLVRILGFRARDYEHWCLFQQSIRDKLETWKIIGDKNLVAAVVSLKGCSVEEGWDILDCIISWSHINKAQWEDITTECEEVELLPILEDGKLTVVC